MSAPMRVGLETLRLFALAKLGWIRKQQVRLRQQPREAPRACVDGESHLVWGKPYRLKVEEKGAPPTVDLTLTELVLRVRPGSSALKRQAVLDAWHADALKKAALPLFEKWEPVMGVKVGKLSTRRMRSRWGTCDTRSHGIRLNTELVTRPVECLEYVIVHEMTHLLEPSHNRRFRTLMTRFMPDWARRRQVLRRLPPASPPGAPECE